MSGVSMMVATEQELAERTSSSGVSRARVTEPDVEVAARPRGGGSAPSIGAGCCGKRRPVAGRAR